MAVIYVALADAFIRSLSLFLVKQEHISAGKMMFFLIFAIRHGKCDFDRHSAKIGVANE